MNDTHGQQGEGWIGFDLDGTLAKYDGWKGFDHIGDPIGPMVALLKKLHAEGTKVKILTARVAPKDRQEVRPNPYVENHWCITSPDDMPWALKDKWTPREYIQDWCWRVLGFVPEITHEKDCFMLDLYDDRCHQVVPNTGETVEGQRDELAAKVEAIRKELVTRPMHEVYTVHVVKKPVDIRWASRILIFFTGLFAGLTVSVWLVSWAVREYGGESETRLHDALEEYMKVQAHGRVVDIVSEAVGR